MAMFLVMVHRSGPDWDGSKALAEQSDWDAHASFMDGLVDDGFIILGGPLADEYRVAHVVESQSEETIRARFADDPWSGSHLVVHSVDPWTIKLDARELAG